MKTKRVNVCCIFTTLAQLKCSHLNKIKMKRRKKNRQTPKHEEEIILTQFEFVRFCEELFRAHRNRRSIYCSENSSFGSLSWYAVMYNKKNESTWLVWLVFPTYQLHITSLLFITASWKIMPHTIPSKETETQLNKEFNVFCCCCCCNCNCNCLLPQTAQHKLLME